MVKGEEWKTNRNQKAEFDEADADLLKIARENIQKIRKGNLKVKLIARGEPVAQSDFEIKQVRHDFKFGLAQLPGKSKVDFFSDQAELIKRLFNTFTAKCYWNERWHQPIEKIENERIYTLFEAEIEQAAKLGMQVKGHPLVWTVPKALPEWLNTYPAEKRLEILLHHVEDMMTRYKGKIAFWDICNEFLWEPSLKHTEQRKWPHIESINEILTYLEPSIRMARKADANAKLVLNDYGLEKNYRPEISAKEQRERYVQLVLEMQKRGIAPDAIGTQCHVAEPFTMNQIQTTLDHLAKANLPLQITEFWARTKGEKAEADVAALQYIENAYTIGFGHPKMELFTYWGGDLFMPNGDAGPKLKVLEKLIGRDWQTNSSFQTNANGQFELSAFFGEYQILKSGKKMAELAFNKYSEGNELIVDVG